MENSKKKSKKKRHLEGTLVFACLFAAFTLIVDVYFLDAVFSMKTILKSVAVAVLAAIPYYFTIRAWSKLK